MSLVLFASERFVEHQTPPGHPESPERADVFDVVAATWRKRGGAVVAPRPATRDEIVRVHDADYYEVIASLSGRATALDPDTFTSPDSFEIACLGAGAAVASVERVMTSAGQRAFALVRPPGHHAERSRAMGFCLFNNVAIAAAHAKTLGAGRVAIVDYDVHHGNGTQHMFEGDASVLYVSTHQFPFYPGTGDFDEIGTGAGAGFTVNLPLEAGATSEDYRLVFARVVRPVLEQFRPELVIISAGFDAHERDPLGGMRLTEAAFAAMTAELCAVADAHCQGRLVAVTEGGYDMRALAESSLAVVDVLAADDPGKTVWPSDARASTRGARSAAATQSALAKHWTFAR
jgi:acetoin utilization deacetylase AcuC-like enzyme